MTGQSRSIQRRIAAQKNLPAPDFSDREQELDATLKRILGRFGDNWSEAVISIDITDIKKAFKEAGSNDTRTVEQVVAEAQAETTWDIAFKAGQLNQSTLDQVNFDKERVKFWNEITESYKAGEKNVVETYQRENPNSYKEYEDWWRIFRKLEGIK